MSSYHIVYLFCTCTARFFSFSLSPFHFSYLQVSSSLVLEILELSNTSFSFMYRFVKNMLLFSTVLLLLGSLCHSRKALCLYWGYSSRIPISISVTLRKSVAVKVVKRQITPSPRHVIATKPIPIFTLK